jgi:hypothetical protein
MYFAIYLTYNSAVAMRYETCWIAVTVTSDILLFNSCSVATFDFESLPFKCPKHDIILKRVRSGERRGQYTGSSLTSTYSKIGYSVTLTKRYDNMKENHVAVRC